MKNRIRRHKKSLVLSLIGLIVGIGVLWASIPQTATASLKKDPDGALLVQAEAGQGFADAGNTTPADFLVVVTDPETGLPVIGLTQSNFTIVNHFSVQGGTCGFSNNIATFNDVLNGAYHIQVGLPVLPGCNWVVGDYLAQVIVNAPVGRGQTTATLSIK